MAVIREPNVKKVLFTILGSAVAALAAGTLIWDIVAPDMGGGSAAAQAGFRVGSIIGTVLRTLVLSAVAVALITKAKGGPGTRHDLARILADHAGMVPSVEPPGTAVYLTLGDEGLLGVYNHLNREAYPERFAALLWVIARRGQDVARPG